METAYNLNEITFKFKKSMAALPGITKKDREVFKHDGVEFYSNERLRQKFIQSLMKFTPVKTHGTIEKLVNKKMLIPAFLTKSTFSWYLKKQSDTEQDDKFRGVYGFFSIRDQKIFILIDAGYKVIGWVPDKHLAAVTLHECMHMAAKKDPTKFMRTNVIPLYKYFAEFLHEVFEVKKELEVKKVLDWVYYLHGFESGKHSLSGKDYIGKIIDAVSPVSNLSDDQIRNRADYILRYAFGTFNSSGHSQLISVVRKYRNVYFALMKAYQEAFGFRAKTLAYQELFAISEVICMIATMELGENKYVSDTLNIIT